MYKQSFDLPEWIWLSTVYGHNYIATELKASVVLMTDLATFFLSHETSHYIDYYTINYTDCV